METNHKKGKNRKAFHVKKHRKSDANRSFDPRSINGEGYDEKPVLFQLGSLASYVVSDVRLTTDPEITSSQCHSLSLSSFSPTFSGDTHEVKRTSSFDNTLSSQVSGVTHVSVEPALISPSVQVMDREGSDQPHRNSSPRLEKNLSTLSNDSLFSLSIGDNPITRDELFSYRDFKAGELLKSGELLSFCPPVHTPVDSYDLGKSFDMEEKASYDPGKSFDMEEKANGTLLSDGEDKSLNSNVSWTNIAECNNSDDAPSSPQSISYPITKKKKKKKKKAKKKTTPQQQQQRQKKRCSWLCCNNAGTCCSGSWLSCKNAGTCCSASWLSCKNAGTCCSASWLCCNNAGTCCSGSWLSCKNVGTCCSCCRWPSCDYNFSCCKRLKCCSCCCRWPKCFSSSCGSLFSCRWSCCFSSSKKVIDDEMTRGSQDQKLQKESKTTHKWFCCFPSCSSFSS